MRDACANESRMAVPPPGVIDLDALDDRRVIVRRACQRADLFREWRDDHPIERRHVAGQRRSRPLHEVHPPRHACAGSTSSANVAPTASWRTRSSVCGTPSSVTVNAVGRSPLTKRPLAILNGCFQKHGGHFRRLVHLERLEHDLVARGIAERVHRFHGDFSSLEGVRVDPLERVGRTGTDRAEKFLVDEEPDLARRRTRRVLDLRHDPDRARDAGAAER